MMEYQGYIGKVEFDDDAAVFHGEVINTRDVITFQGESVTELKAAFCESIDDYLAFCKAREEQPETPSSGQFMTRITPELHRRVSLAAGRSGQSLNSWVSEQLRLAVSQEPSSPANHGSQKAKQGGHDSSQRSARNISKTS